MVELIGKKVCGRGNRSMMQHTVQIGGSIIVFIYVLEDHARNPACVRRLNSGYEPVDSTAGGIYSIDQRRCLDSMNKRHIPPLFQ